jgi:hypothetical protein
MVMVSSFIFYTKEEGTKARTKVVELMKGGKQI